MPVDDLDALWDFADPAGSEERFRARLATLEVVADEPAQAETLTQIARAQGLTGNYDEALRTLDRADSLAETHPGVIRVRCLLERGRVFNSSETGDRGKNCFLQAWELARRHGDDFFAVDAAHMLGIIEDLHTQLDWSLRALEVAQRSKQPRTRTWLGPLYNNLGWTFHDLRRYDEALEFFTQSLAWRRDQGQPMEAGIAAWTVGRCLRSLGRLEEALDLQRENLDAASKVGAGAGMIEEEIGECLLGLGRSIEARQHFDRAYQELSKDTWLAEHEAARLERVRVLAAR